MIVSSVFFYLFSGIMIAAAFMVISSRNPVHSVLFLILTFVNAAGLFIISKKNPLVAVFVNLMSIRFLP